MKLLDKIKSLDYTGFILSLVNRQWGTLIATKAGTTFVPPISTNTEVFRTVGTINGNAVIATSIRPLMENYVVYSYDGEAWAAWMLFSR